MTKCIQKSQKIMVRPNGFILDFFKHIVQRVNILREILPIGQQSTFIPGDYFRNRNGELDKLAT